MIRIFLFDRRLLQEDTPIDFGKAETERISAIRNPTRRSESLAALTALSELIRISFGDVNLEILRDKNGKPYFKNSDISFSLSHSGDISVAALCDEKYNLIGVDVEKIADRANIEELSQRFFSSDEKQEFIKRGKAQKAFFDIWTKKEAYAKMTGEGLASVLGDQAHHGSKNAESICYEFYNNSDIYSLSLCCSSKIKNVEFYNNSSNIKIKSHRTKGVKNDGF